MMGRGKRTKEPGWRSVYDALRTEILALTLQPGQLLDETTLAERFNMSRSPVREALIRLAAEELVVTLPNRSTIVAPIELATFPKYVDALDIAQRMNTRLAAELRTDADLEAMASRQRAFEAAVKSGDHLAMSEPTRTSTWRSRQPGGIRISPASTRSCSTRGGGCCTCISTSSSGRTKAIF